MPKISPKWIVLLGVVFVSFSSIFIRMSEAPSLVIATYRMGFTVLLLLPFVIKNKKKELKTIDGKSLLTCFISGIFLALHFATWITSIRYTSIASSTVLVNTHTLFIAMGTLFILKEKVPKKAFISMGVTLFGSIIISLGDHSMGSNVLYGDILAILGAFFVAGYMMIGRIVRQSISVTTYTFVVYTSCTFTLLLLAMVTGTSLYPYPIKEWFIFLALAIFCTILGHSIFNWALAYIKPTFLSTAILGEPVFATLWALLLFQEVPAIWQISGSLMIIFGIYLYIQMNEEKNPVILDEK
ncbi:drug/metabolite transporter (DMT)-like permease [Anaerosolibacter carboniphilus]|uniref:Drug/metabolite transporter (DMT)-like permease n=1 Tax=Anaerosolibacter carboniphilus TaxID=1417629 RepID=A0A841KTL4_9FIRM|nr:DMT family transporter [Anaerosolibacter carboniphilus]MBB6216761.1 drug/metabolite transporter (DMT)-like permease [Anaerosolibacter carboniphilus]